MIEEKEGKGPARLEGEPIVVGSCIRYIVTSESFNQTRWDIKDHVF